MLTSTWAGVGRLGLKKDLQNFKWTALKAGASQNGITDIMAVDQMCTPKGTLSILKKSKNISFHHLCISLIYVVALNRVACSIFQNYLHAPIHINTMASKKMENLFGWTFIR